MENLLTLYSLLQRISSIADPSAVTLTGLMATTIPTTPCTPERLAMEEVHSPKSTSLPRSCEFLATLLRFKDPGGFPQLPGTPKHLLLAVYAFTPSS